MREVFQFEQSFAGIITMNPMEEFTEYTTSLEPAILEDNNINAGGILEQRQQKKKIQEAEDQEKYQLFLQTFSMENFLDKIPMKDQDGCDIPQWKREMLARKAAEKAKKIASEECEKDAESKKLASLPAWQRQMVEKQSISKTNGVGDEKPVQLDNILTDFQSKLENSKDESAEATKSNDMPDAFDINVKAITKMFSTTRSQESGSTKKLKAPEKSDEKKDAPLEEKEFVIEKEQSFARWSSSQKSSQAETQSVARPQAAVGLYKLSDEEIAMRLQAKLEHKKMEINNSVDNESPESRSRSIVVVETYGSDGDRKIGRLGEDNSKDFSPVREKLENILANRRSFNGPPQTTPTTLPRNMPVEGPTTEDVVTIDQTTKSIVVDKTTKKQVKAEDEVEAETIIEPLHPHVPVPATRASVKKRSLDNGFGVANPLPKVGQTPFFKISTFDNSTTDYYGIAKNGV